MSKPDLYEEIMSLADKWERDAKKIRPTIERRMLSKHANLLRDIARRYIVDRIHAPGKAEAYNNMTAEQFAGKAEASAPVDEEAKQRDWAKIRDYMDCLDDTEEQKKLRMRWVREMKAENDELRRKLKLPRRPAPPPVKLTQAQAIEAAKRIRDEAEQRRADAREREAAETAPPPVEARWLCTNCGMEVKDSEAIAHADLPSTVKVWHKNTDGVWCGPVEKERQP